MSARFRSAHLLAAAIAATLPDGVLSIEEAPDDPPHPTPFLRQPAAPKVHTHAREIARRKRQLAKRQSQDKP